MDSRSHSPVLPGATEDDGNPDEGLQEIGGQQAPIDSGHGSTSTGLGSTQHEDLEDAEHEPVQNSASSLIQRRPTVEVHSAPESPAEDRSGYTEPWVPTPSSFPLSVHSTPESRAPTPTPLFFPAPESRAPAPSSLFSTAYNLEQSGFIETYTGDPQAPADATIEFSEFFPSPRPSEISIENAREFYPGCPQDSPLARGPFIDNAGEFIERFGEAQMTPSSSREGNVIAPFPSDLTRSPGQQSSTSTILAHDDSRDNRGLFGEDEPAGKPEQAEGLFGPESPRETPRALPGAMVPVDRSARPIPMRSVRTDGTRSGRRPKKKVTFQLESGHSVPVGTVIVARSSGKTDAPRAKQAGDKKESEDKASMKAKSNTTDTPRYDPSAGVPDVDIWPLYLQHALSQDKETVETWDSDLDSILIFAALFSAVLTTLVAESYKNLQADPQVEMMRAVLLQLQRNSNDPSGDVPVPVPPFRVTSSAVRVNVYWFSSLIISLSAALIAILAKQWVNYLLAGLSPVPPIGGRHRQYRVDGLHKWNLPAILSFIPLLLHIALLLFFAGLVDFVWDLDSSVGAVSATLVVATFLMYVATNVLSYIYPECPFKTSVTVFISLAHELFKIWRTKLLLTAELTWVSISTTAIRVLSSLAPDRVADSNTLKKAMSDLRDTVDFVESEKSRYNTLRVSSLRYQDEQYISQNASLVDTRVLIWMVHHVSRLANPEELGHALMRFPHLIRHRELFMQEGASTFLERLLHKWFDAPWTELGSTHRRNVTAAVRTLGMLFSEAVADGTDFKEATVPEGTVMDQTPFLLVQRPSQTAQQLLSSHSLKLVAHLLASIRGLPLPLQAFTLRLSVQLNKEDSAVIWATLDRHKVFDDFVFRVQSFTADDRHRKELIPAVNTVIYLALCEAAYPRDPSSPLPPSHHVSYWLHSLLNIMNLAPMDSVVLRQICWGMSALTWTITPQANGVTVRPLIPRLDNQSMRQLACSLTDLLHWGQDPQVLNAIVMTLDCMLYHIGSQVQWDGHGEICEALHLKYWEFLGELLKRLHSGAVSATRITPILSSLIRIAAYLSFFDRNAPADAKVLLASTTLSIFKYLITAQKPPKTAADSSQPSSSQPTRSKTVSRQELEERWVISILTRRWVYRAACRFVDLYMNDPKWKLDYQGPKPAEFHNKSDALESIIAIGSDIVSAVESISVRRADDSRFTVTAHRPPVVMPALTMESFCTIGKDIFTYGLRPNTDLREVGGWDGKITQMVAEAVRSRNMLEVLLSSERPCVHVDLLVQAVHYIYAVLHSGGRPLETSILSGKLQGTTIMGRNDSRHPAHHMASALRQSFLPFLRKFTERVRNGERLYPEMQELVVELTGIAGYMAFFDQPSKLPRPRIVEGMVQYLQVVSALGKPRNSAHVPAAVRVHAWGALCTVAELHLHKASALARDDHPARHFRFEGATADAIAIGFVRVVCTWFVKLRRGVYKAHCEDCELDEEVADAESTEDRWKLNHLPEALIETALEMMVQICDDDDNRGEDGDGDGEGVARGIWSRLLHHQIEPQVRILSLVLRGRAGGLAAKLLARIQIASSNGKPMQRSMTL